MNPHDALDQWLRRHADQPAADAPGWDTPSEAVWTRIAAARARRKRRRMFWWWLTGIGVVLAGLILWSSRGNRPAAPDQGQQARWEAAATEPPESRTSAQAIPSPETAAPATEHFSSRADIYFPKKTNSTPEQATVRQLLATSPVDDPKPGEAPGAAPIDLAGTKDVPRFAALPVSLQPVAQPVPQAIRFTRPAGQSPRRSQWYGGFFLHRAYTDRTVRGAALPNGQEQGAWSSRFGGLVGLSLNRHWALESGLEWYAMHLHARRRAQFRFRGDQERFNAQRQLFESSATQSLPTSLGQVEFRMDIGRDPNQTIANQTIINVAFQTSETARYLRLPLALRYQAGRGRWRWSAAGGLGASLRVGHDLTVEAVRADRNAIRAVRVAKQRLGGDWARLGADMQLGLGLEYRATPAWALRLAPEFRRGLTSAGQNVRAYPWAAGISLQVLYFQP